MTGDHVVVQCTTCTAVPGIPEKEVFAESIFLSFKSLGPEGS